MNNDTTVTTAPDTVRSHAQKALAAVNALILRKAEFKAKYEALEALPKTPTGRTKRSVAEAIEAIDGERAHAYEHTESVLCAYKNALIKEVREACRKSGSESETTRVLKAEGFEPINPALKNDLVIASDLIRKHNETASRKEAVYCTYVNPDDRLYVNASTNVLLILQDYEFTGGYVIGFAGHYALNSRDGLGLYIPDNARDLSHFSDYTKGKVNLSAIGSEHEDECAARLARIICIIKANKALRVHAPCVSPQSNYFDRIMSLVHYRPDETDTVIAALRDRDYEDLKAVAAGKAVNISIVTSQREGESAFVNPDVSVGNDVFEYTVDSSDYVGRKAKKHVRIQPVHTVVYEAL